MAGIFVIGVDTGVGKTIVSAGLMLLLNGTRKLQYWKPVQTGTIVGDDTTEVRNLSGLNNESFTEPTYKFPDPLSPHMAAKKWNKEIDVKELIRVAKEREADGAFLVVEGAGGLLVPFNEHELQIDFIKATKFPVIIVAQDRVGAINQTLLTANAARAVGIDIVGVVLTRSRGQFGNSESIATFGKLDILAEFPPTDDKRSLVAQVGANEKLRNYFKVPRLPR